MTPTLGRKGRDMESVEAEGRSIDDAESPLERSERLEQLRFLDNGIAIHVAETPYDTIGVDTDEDLRRVEKALRER